VLVAILCTGSAIALSPPGTDDEIRRRIAPAGSLCRQGEACAGENRVADVAAGPRDAEQIYGQFCIACHLSGVAGAPKLDDSVAWAERLEQGMAVLYNSTINGKAPGMPARGTCIDCSDDELRATVDYMIAQQ